MHRKNKRKTQEEKRKEGRKPEEART